MAKREELEQLIEPTVTGMGYEFVGLELVKGRGALVRLYIDRTGGVGLNDCEAVSREVEAMLDVHDPLKGAYTLEVSSPGLDRPLFTAEHFRRFVGHRAKVTLQAPLDGRRKFDGSILGVSDDDSVRFEQDGREVRLPIAEMRKAHLVYEF